MRVSQWWSYLVGYLTIRVEGERLEPFINMAMTRGIRLWDLRRTEAGALTARVRVSGFYSLRHIARINRCRMRIVRRHGFPFLAARLERRKMLALGAVCFLALLYILSSLVWFIEVVGNQQVPAQEILMVAEREGFRVGAPRWRLDKQGLEKVLAREFPQVAFFGVKVRGTQVVIEVVEKRMPPPDGRQQGRAHLVAARSGVIEDVIVMKGDPLVKPGDTVQAGQMLISGILPVPGTGSLTPPPGVVLPPPASLESEEVIAQGLVKARVWYQAYGENPVVERRRRPTGERAVRLRAVSLGHEVLVYGPREIPYADFEREEREIRLGSSPVVLVWERVSEMEDEVIEYGVDRAKELAADKARQEIVEARMADSRVILEKVDAVELNDDNLVRVRVRVEALEDIGVRQDF